MKKLYFLLIASIWGITLLGQASITLQWQVTNEQNEPLVGVSVWKKQTSEGTTTDKNGMFWIDVVPGRDELEISYLGFETSKIVISKEMKAKGVEILIPAEYNLPEVTILAYNGWRRCCCFGVAVSKITGLDTIPAFNIFQPKIRIYPTPTKASVFLQQETPLGNLDLYNLNGQKLQSFNFNDQLNASINLGAWPSGTYFLRSSKGWMEKVILQKQ
jgi:CarboxypepD_reg-like domain/Secretion system C-terminal sorting domain